VSAPGERPGAIANLAGDEGCSVIKLGPGTRAFPARQPIDLRNAFDGLAAMEKQVIGDGPLSGQLFRGKRGDYLKPLCMPRRSTSRSAFKTIWQQTQIE
jgi:hypothetical protein